MLLFNELYMNITCNIWFNIKVILNKNNYKALDLVDYYDFTLTLFSFKIV